MSAIPTHRVILSRALSCLLCAPLLAAAQQPSKTDSLARFAGTWEGKCQDGRTFVVLTLQPVGDQMAGAVSIANMHGDDEGACMLVKDPPTPEHAQKITHACVEDAVLSFQGALQPNGKSPRFELKETGRGQGELKLLDTPVEQHPWILVKKEKPE